MTATILSSVLVGLEAQPRTITATRAEGRLRLEGLRDITAREIHTTVTRALDALGVDSGGVVVRVDNGDHIRESLDLPIALAIAQAKGVFLRPAGEQPIFAVGSFSAWLDGTRTRVGPVRGLLSHLEGAPANALVLAPDSDQAGLVPREVLQVRNLWEALTWRVNPSERWRMPSFGGRLFTMEPEPALALAIQRGARRILLVGPRGADLIAAAANLGSCLPTPSEDEVRTITRIHAAAGIAATVLVKRPFRAPHHTVSEAGLIGGTASCRPGEVSLAHHGVLLLHELPEFRLGAVEAVMRALDERQVVLPSTSGPCHLPAAPSLVVGTSLPCPCGLLGTGRCRCSDTARHRYQKVADDIFRSDYTLFLDPAGQAAASS